MTLRECLTYKRPTATDVSHLRSLLFAPGSDERKLRKALASEADGVVADLEDAVVPGEKESAREIVARSLGLRGKLCIHPAQVEVVNRVFAPQEEELEWARRVIAAYEQGIREGRGAVALDGRMIDLPVVERARHVLAEAKGAANGG